MATSSINVNSFAWRLITGKEIKIDESLHLDTTNASSSSSSPQKTQYFPPYPPSLLTKSGIVDEDHIFQLKAIFMHFDTNKDGYISYEQLCSALTYLGLPTREKFIKKFCSPMSTLKNNPSKLSYSNNIDEKMSTTSSLNQRKVHGHIILNFNTDLKTFIMTIGKCINEFKQQKKMLEELFTFMLPDENPFGINAPPVISRASVTHLLRDISTGTSFNGQDAAKILKLLPFFPLPPEMIRKKRKKIKNSIDFEKKVLVEVENVPYYEDELWIEVEELIHLLIFQIVDDDNE